jgi:hypothetical protein
MHGKGYHGFAARVELSTKTSSCWFGVKENNGGSTKHCFTRHPPHPAVVLPQSCPLPPS